MRIHLIRSKDVKRGLFDQVYDLLINENGPAQFIKEHATISFDGTALSWETIFNKYSECRLNENLSPDDFVILLTSKENENNWFSCADPSGTRSVFIHTAGWDNYLIDCEPRYPLAFQCWENLLGALVFRSVEDVKFLHDPPIGCIADMCSWKPDIIYKLRTA